MILFGYSEILDESVDLPPHLEELLDFADSQLTDLFDLIMRQVLPKRTWNVVHVTFMTGLNLEIEIGQDHRILEWNRMHSKRLKREGLWKLSNL